MVTNDFHQTLIVHNLAFRPEKKTSENDFLIKCGHCLHENEYKKKCLPNNMRTHDVAI